MLKHERCYVSSNCNQTPTAVHWGQNGLICYAANSAVLIYDPKGGSGGRVVASLIGHTKRVTSVRWLRSSDNELVSGSSDGTAMVWKRVAHEAQIIYQSFALKGHESNVNLVDGVSETSRTVVVTVGMDLCIKIWVRGGNSEEFLLAQDLKHHYNICVGIRIYPYDDALVLACAMDNSKIDIYIEENKKFAPKGVLKGHEDWVQGLDFTTDVTDDLLLASSSQDCYIRLWRFTPLDTPIEADNNTLSINKKMYKISTDSILTGHDGWIYSVNWHPTLPRLLSASLDKSMIIWELDRDSNLWLDKIRVGEVGGNTLGFYGGMFSPDGESMLGHGFNGAFHLWRNADGEMKPCVTVGGHFGEVTDLGWEPRGEFLVTVGADQTTRIHAPWSREGDDATWHEIARPQVHGYGLSSIAIVSRYKFASSAEEKVIRVFQSPVNFIENFSRICNISPEIINEESTPQGASVPSLGLSNKGVFADKGGGDAPDSSFTAVDLTEPPTEETLLQNTLWPEVQKLYGHGYEVYSLAASPDRRCLASACKATTPEHAAILLWDTATWTQVQRLLSHSLTVAQMAFSPDSRHLLSVSRDRRWSLFSKKATGFEMVATTDKRTSIHTRIIWCCGWTHDSEYFATGSRDGKIVVWGRNENKKEKGGVLGEYEAASEHLELKNEAVTAVTFAPGLALGGYLTAVGLEVGVILCYKWTSEGWEKLLFLDQSGAHHSTVKRLAFRPIWGKAGETSDDGDRVLQLASCSSDYSVIVHNILIE